MKSNALSLNARDFLKGLVMAIMVPVLLIIQQSLEAGTLTFNWGQIGMAAIAGAVAYLLKNYFTNDVPSAVKTIEKAGGTVYDKK